MTENQQSELEFSDTKHNLDVSIKFMQALLHSGVLQKVNLKAYMALIGQLTGVLDVSWKRGQAGTGEMQPPAGQQLADFVRNTQYVVMDKPRNM